MAEANLVGGVVGGVLIGLAAVVLLAMNGRIAGISGILGGLISTRESRERRWRLVFIFGLIAAPVLYRILRGDLPVHLQVEPPALLIAGLLVGFGTGLGSGCTSGHGVCGIARRSPRSLAATATFVACGILTVYLIRQFR